MPDDWENAVAVIGTRNPSLATVEATEQVVAALATRESTIVVSGLALGTDAVAHAAALSHRVRTVAVLANGPDTVYPKSNASLGEQIVAAGGCLLSETPTGEGVKQSISWREIVCRAVCRERRS